MAKPIRRAVALSSTLMFVAFMVCVPFVEFAQAPQPNFNLTVQGRFNDLQKEIGLVRLEHMRLSGSVMGIGEMVKQQGQSLESLRRTLDGLTVGPLASPLSHDLDKRVVRLEAYMEADKAIKTEFAWWGRTVGAAAAVWAIRQVWGLIARGKRKRRDRRAAEETAE